jgi:hypothetical protein
MRHGERMLLARFVTSLPGACVLSGIVDKLAAKGDNDVRCNHARIGAQGA